MGVKDDGTPDRRHVKAKTGAAVTKQARQLEPERDRRQARRAGERWTAAEWLRG